MRIEQITFPEIEDVWKKELWPTRTDPIRHMSSMIFKGGYDLSVYSKYSPSFWGAKNGDQLVAVLSGHGCGANYRSRGLWVKQSYRRMGLATQLMSALFTQAHEEKFHSVWTFPRFSSLSFYQSLGFSQKSEWVQSSTGQLNCYALKRLPSNESPL